MSNGTSNREKLVSVLLDKMNNERAKTAIEILDSFDKYIVEQGISEEGLYEISSIIKVSGLMSRVKTDEQIKNKYKGKLFFLERGLFHYRNILIDFQKQFDAENAWKEEGFIQDIEENSNYAGEDIGINDKENETYDEEIITQMLNDPEGFIRFLSKRTKQQ